MHLADNDKMTCEELSELTGVPEDAVAKRMSYWVVKGVAKETVQSKSLSIEEMSPYEESSNEILYEIIEDQSLRAIADQNGVRGDAAEALDMDTDDCDVRLPFTIYIYIIQPDTNLIFCACVC